MMTFIFKLWKAFLCPLRLNWIFFKAFGLLLCLIAALVFTVTTYMILELGRTFSPDVILLLVETTSTESGEFLRQYLGTPHTLWYLLMFIAIMAFIVFAERRQSLLSEKLKAKTWRKYTCVGLFVFVMAAGVYKIAETKMGRVAEGDRGYLQA